MSEPENEDIRLLGGIFLGCGMLIVAVSGLCSLMALFNAISPKKSGHSGPLLLVLAIPLVVGAVLMFVGMKFSQQRFSRDDDDWVP